MATFFQWSELWVKFITAILGNKVLTTLLIGIFTSAVVNTVQFFQNDDLAIKLNNTQQTAQYLEDMIMKPPIEMKQPTDNKVIKNITVECPDCIKRIEKLEGMHK